ncbi:MAG: hypothetical protein H7X77_01580 [Anaerolineae bacterium]|nr:hypothetical protein [Anaerolineae bacterium]
MNLDLNNLPLRYIATLIAAIELVVVLYIIFVQHQPGIAILIATMNLLAFVSGMMQEKGENTLKTTKR